MDKFKGLKEGQKIRITSVYEGELVSSSKALVRLRAPGTTSVLDEYFIRGGNVTRVDPVVETGDVIHNLTNGVVYCKLPDGRYQNFLGVEVLARYAELGDFEIISTAASRRAQREQARGAGSPAPSSRTKAC